MSTRGLAAIAKHYDQPLCLEEIEFSDPGAGEVLVKVGVSGICHTDLHAIAGGWGVRPALPFIPGHEGAGVVVKVGAGIQDLREGDRVGLPWLRLACGKCEWCLSGRETICPKAQYGGFNVNGSFAEYCVAAADFVIPLPKTLSNMAAAPILCAGLTMWNALKRASVKAGDWVAIVGCGGLGHMGIQYARCMGLHVVAIDVADDKLSLAHKLGASLLVDARECEVGEKVQKEIGGAHATVVTAPSLHAVNDGLAAVRRGGTCVVVGLPRGQVQVPLFDIVAREVRVLGSLVGTRLDAQEALAFAADGRVQPLTQERPFSAVNEALEDLAAGRVQGRFVLHM